MTSVKSCATTAGAGLFLCVIFLTVSHSSLAQRETKIELGQENTTADYEIEEKNNTNSNGPTWNVTLLAESIFFVENLFKKYGDEKEMSILHLKHLIEHLGLNASANEQHGHNHEHDHKEHTDHTDHTTHKRSVSVSYEERKKLKSSLLNECVGAKNILKAFQLEHKGSLTMAQFASLCPALVYQLDTDVCRPNHLHTHDDDENHEKVPSEDTHHHMSSRVWGFSIAAVTVISLVGLLGVAVIPIMQKVFYNHMLQFLVAMAIGALSGDALLHLLPHAIVQSSEHKHEDETSHSGEEEHDHKAAAYKGLVALCGILFFFIAERLLTIITAMKRDKNSRKQKKKRRCEKYCDVETQQKQSVAGKLSTGGGVEDNCDNSIVLVHPNKDESNELTPIALKGYADAAHDEFMHQCDEDSMEAMKPSVDPDVELMEVSRSHGHSHGHSHGSHGHGHSVPTSVAAVAWMVILGDGIHNFSDGLAIGAAFANSITGGLSTSIAVFCHELPHEIGDFALLLRAGMSPRKAILYNCLSSFLCLLGMVIGVAIGNIESASFWIFAAVGGMFLYIALVDMLPEMSSLDTKKGENPFLHLLLQVVGILTGLSIMLFIALFEHEIRQALD